MKKINFGILSLCSSLLVLVIWTIYGFLLFKYMVKSGPEWLNMNYVATIFLIVIVVGFFSSILGFLFKQHRVISLICLIFTGSLFMLKLFSMF